MRADHWAEYRDGDQFRDGGDRREQHRQKIGSCLILFKLIAVVIALVLFPVVTPLLIHASSTIDGVTLLAGYQTAYNVVGVAVVLPLIGKFTRFVELILPERGSPLTRCLDSSVLVPTIPKW